MIFEDLAFVFYERLLASKQRQILTGLIEKNGGLVSPSIITTEPISKSIILLVKDKSVCTGKAFQSLQDNYDLVVPIQWVSDCISQNRRIDPSSYVISNTSKRKYSSSGSSRSSSNHSIDGSDQSLSQSLDSLDIPEWCCMRRTGCKTILNPSLEQTLDYLARLRWAQQEKYRAEAYEKAVSVVRALPITIQKSSQLDPIPHMGQSVKAKLKKVIDSPTFRNYAGDHFVRDVVEPLFPPNSDQDRAVMELTRVHGIGPSKAISLYKSFGVKNVTDLVDKCDNLTKNLTRDTFLVLKNWSRIKQTVTLDEAKNVLDIVKDCLDIPHDDNNVGDTWMALMPVGGFRRGKVTGHDLDILVVAGITDKEAFIASDAVKETQGIHPIILKQTTSTLSSFASNPKLSDKIFCQLSHRHHSESKQKEEEEEGSSILLLFNLNENLLRVDFIWARADKPSFPFMLLGWTGSQHFLQSMRLYAKKHLNASLSNYGISGSTATDHDFTSERDIFDFLGIPYIEPTWRNA